MIKTKTLFILGAGASNPYGYSTGKGLRNYICTTFENRFSEIVSRENITPTISEWSYAANDFSKIFKNSTTPSIDLWLARNPNFSDIGKLAIILSIFDDERKSKFREDIEPDQDWYSYLYRRMTSSLITPESYKNFRNNKVTFITFNYDRSLEHFLFESLVSSFHHASKTEILKELNEIPIYHVYGKITDLPWESNRNTATAIKYLKPDDDPYLKFSTDSLEKLLDNIKIVHEREQHDCAEIHDKISSAERIFFLGFGYASENLEILNINKTLKDEQAIFGTALKFSKNEIKNVKKSITSNFKYKKEVYQNPIIEDMNCVSLLKEYL